MNLTSIEWRIRRILGMKQRYELEREAESEKENIAEGHPDPKIFQMYYCFEYDHKEHTLNISKVGINPRLYRLNKRSEDIENQNHRWAKEYVSRYGFEFEDRDDYNKKDWWMASDLKLMEVRDQQEARRIVTDLADKMFVGHGDITFTEMDERNPGGLWMYFYAKAMPLRDFNPRFGNRYSEYEDKEFEIGIRQDREYARLYFNLGYWGFYWRYDVPPVKWYNGYDFKINYYAETTSEKYIPVLPEYVPENVRNLPDEEFKWKVGNIIVRKIKGSDRERMHKDHSYQWGIFNLYKDDDFFMPCKTKLAAVEWLHEYLEPRVKS